MNVLNVLEIIPYNLSPFSPIILYFIIIFHFYFAFSHFFQEPKHAVESKLSIIQRRELSYLWIACLFQKRDGNRGPFQILAETINTNIYDLCNVQYCHAVSSLPDSSEVVLVFLIEIVKKHSNLFLLFLVVVLLQQFSSITDQKSARIVNELVLCSSQLDAMNFDFFSSYVFCAQHFSP